jgi:hypothetical protein
MHGAACSAILSTVKRKWSWCLQLLLPGFKVLQEFSISAKFSTRKILIDSLALLRLRRCCQLEKKKVAVHKINMRGTRGTRGTRQIAKRQVACVYPKANIAGILGFYNYTREHVQPYLMHLQGKRGVLSPRSSKSCHEFGISDFSFKE